MNRVSNTIGFRIAAGYSILVLVSYMALMMISYFFLSSALRHKDTEQVSVELQSLRSTYMEGGIDSFHELVLTNDKFRKNNPFFTRVFGREGQAARIYFPQYWSEFDLKALDQMPVGRSGTWMRLPSRKGSHALEILNEEMADGFRFQVGISTEERQAVLQRFRETFLFGTIPLLAFCLVGGALLAQRSLRPVRHLIQTVASIHSGQLEARAPRTHNGDELDDLGRLFNEMIERIRSLIHGMRQALDTVAHDLRTPMTRFRNLAEEALRQGGDPQGCQTALQKCVEESDNILRMLNVLMDISEAETGTLQLNRREVDLSLLADDVGEMYRYVAEEKNIDVQTSIAPGVHATIDRERMSQALANLLDNAVKYTQPGGRIDLTLTADSREATLRVLDTGTGIDSEHLDRIWDRLYRGPHEDTRGMGLGLSLVRAIAQAHGGEVTAVNRADKGAAFQMVIPLWVQGARSSVP